MRQKSNSTPASSETLVRNIRRVLDAGLELHLPDHSDLEAEVTQSTAQVVLNGNGLRLKQFAMGQQHS